MALPAIRRGGRNVPVRRTETGNQPGAVATFSPWTEVDYFDRLYDSFIRSPFQALAPSLTRIAQQAEPVIELYETQNELLACIFAPGIAPDTLDITATGESFMIKGERRPLIEQTEGVTALTWSNYAATTSRFDLNYDLPVEIDADKIQATYKNGVIQLQMPKSEAASTSRKVEVKNT